MDKTPVRRSPALEPERYEHMKALVGRYPDISAEEAADLSMYLRKGPMLDRALLSAVPEIQQSLNQFEADHLSELSLGKLQYVVGLLFVALMVAGAYLAWDAAL